MAISLRTNVQWFSLVQTVYKLCICCGLMSAMAITCTYYSISQLSSFSEMFSEHGDGGGNRVLPLEG